MDFDPVADLNQLKTQLGTLDAVVIALLPHYRYPAEARSKGTLSRVLHGERCPLAVENALRLRAGLQPRWPPRVVDACPSCGEPHLAGDCHGRPVAQVVCLGPDEVVAPAPAPKRKLPSRAPCLRPRLSLDPHVRLQQLARLVGKAVCEIGIEERSRGSAAQRRPLD